MYVSSEDRKAAYGRPFFLRNDVSMTPFAERLALAVEVKGAPLCVGIDPDPALMPAGVGLTEFCRGIVDAGAPGTAVVKPQTAFFETSATTRALPAS